MRFKKSIIVTILTTIYFTSTAQIQVTNVSTEKTTTVGSAKSGFDKLAELTYKPTKEEDGSIDTVYYLLFRNQEYTQIKDYKGILFTAGTDEIDQLYNVFRTFFTDENKGNKDYSVNMKLGKYDVFLKADKMFGVSCVYLSADGGHVYLTEKQVNKLFGK